MFLKNAWYAAGWSDELAVGQLRQHFLIGEPVVLFRRADGSAGAMEDRCAHRNAALSKGRLEDDGLRCLYHGLKFDTHSGRCVEIPGQPRIGEVGVKTYPVIEREGWLFVWMGDAAAADPALVPPVVGPQSDTWTVARSHMDYQANYVLINDNLSDFSHLAFVHVNSFGGGVPEALRMFAYEKPTIEPLERGIRMTRWVEGVEAPVYRRTESVTGRVDRFSTYDYLAPGVLLMFSAIYPEGTCRATGGKRPDIAPLFADFTSQTVIPLTATTSRYYFTWGPRQEDVLPGMVAGMGQLAELAFTEDREMIEAQQRILDATPSPRFTPIVHDRGPNHMRLVMERLMQAEREGAAVPG